MAPGFSSTHAMTRGAKNRLKPRKIRTHEERDRPGDPHERAGAAGRAGGGASAPRAARAAGGCGRCGAPRTLPWARGVGSFGLLEGSPVRRRASRYCCRISRAAAESSSPLARRGTAGPSRAGARRPPTSSAARPRTRSRRPISVRPSPKLRAAAAWSPSLPSMFSGRPTTTSSAPSAQASCATSCKSTARLRRWIAGRAKAMPVSVSPTATPMRRAPWSRPMIVLTASPTGPARRPRCRCAGRSASRARAPIAPSPATGSRVAAPRSRQRRLRLLRRATPDASQDLIGIGHGPPRRRSR